ncbi:MAG: glutathione S-transferase family protein [Acidobacteriota bacterium]
MITLYEFDSSAYCAKVRKILEYKGLPFERVEIDYLARTEPRALSGQPLVPVIKDGDRVVADSTAIALDLEERYPTPALLPAGAARIHALLLEDWSDTHLEKVAAPVHLLGPGNTDAIARTAIARRPPAPLVRPFARLGGPLLRAQSAWHHRGRTYGQHLAAFDAELDRLEALFAVSPFALGEQPTLPDFAFFGVLAVLEGLSGFERVEARPSLARWYGRVKALASPG